MPVHEDPSPRPAADLAHHDAVPARTGSSRRTPSPAARTRAGAAWVGICVGALVLVALVVFMLQNTAPVEVAFLGMRGSAPLALMLLIAGVGVGVVALVVGSLRIGQLRRRIRADRTIPAQTARRPPDLRTTGDTDDDLR